MIDVSKWKNEKTKIAVPITGNNIESIKEQASNIKETDNVDLIEWRVDYLDDPFNINSLNRLNEIINQIKLPLIVTFRTFNEGGKNKLISELDYFKILDLFIQYLSFDILDVEMKHDSSKFQNIINKAHLNDILVIESNHDFSESFSTKSLLQRFKSMYFQGADVAKIAIMPKSAKDVISIMNASLTAKTELPIPIVSMAMGKIGILSRIAGNNFGSCVSFGSLGKSSAPGQLDKDTLQKIMNIID